MSARPPVTAPLHGWPTAPARLTPAADEVHVWSAGLDRPAAEVAELAQILSDEERARAGRFRPVAARSRDEFIVARALLRFLLGGCLGLDPRQVRFSHTARGKPRLAGPDPAPLCFNVSHSHGMALFAVSGRCEVGVDLERIRLRPDTDLLGMAERYFAPREAEALRSLEAEALVETFFRLWTRKEAYLKAHGLGISYGLERVEVSHAADEPARIVHIDGDHEAAACWSLYTLAPAAGYVGALAIQAHNHRLHCWRWADA